MSVSDKDHDTMSSLAKSIATTIMEIMDMSRGLGVIMQPLEHFCAYSHDEDAEELVVRTRDSSISVKITIQGADYAKDRENTEYTDHINSAIDKVIESIFKEGHTDNDE